MTADGSAADPPRTGEPRDAAGLDVLIVDDEPLARRGVRELVAGRPNVAEVREAGGGAEAVRVIRERRPDLVFLDVQMPRVDGFGVIEAVGLLAMPPVVFVTAYDAHAVRAFEVHAVDYLLKPYDQARFRTALARARERIHPSPNESDAPPDDDVRLRALLRGLLESGGGPEGARELVAPASAEHVAVRVDGALRIVRLDEIDWFETEGNYVRIHAGRQSYLVRQTAAHLESQLDPRRFVRIHRRYLVNLARVHEVQPWFGGDAVVVLRDGTKLRLSRTYREQFHSRFLGESGKL